MCPTVGTGGSGTGSGSRPSAVRLDAPKSCALGFLAQCLPLLRAGADQPGGGMRRDEEKTMSLEEAKRDLWRLKPAL